MLSVSPTVAKYIAVALAIAAVVASRFVVDGPGHDLLLAIAGGLVGKEVFRRTGDALVDGVHPDDIRGQ